MRCRSVELVVVNRTLLLYIALLVLPDAGNAQTVPEGTHRLSQGPTTICGVTADDPADFAKAVRSSRRFHKAPVDSDRFDLYVTADELSEQWVLTKPGDRAHPAVTCRHVFQNKHGSWLHSREMRCGASRAACDSLFIEFRELDESMIREIRRTR